jgi:hypothetical protein
MEARGSTIELEEFQQHQMSCSSRSSFIAFLYLPFSILHPQSSIFPSPVSLSPGRYFPTEHRAMLPFSPTPQPALAPTTLNA